MPRGPGGESAAPAAEPISSGAIAQLGERLLCKQEVVGSIPSGSTIFARSAAEEHGIHARLVHLARA